MSAALLGLVNAAWVNAAVEAAHRLGLIEYLEGRAVGVDTLARERGLSQRGTAALLDALDGIGVVTRVGGTYTAAAGTGAAIRLLTSPVSLVDTIRTGRPTHAGDTRTGAAALYPDVVGPIGTLAEEAANRAADLLGGSVEQVLDVGAGSAVWSIAHARRRPACRVTALDLPEVLPLTRRNVVDADMAERFRFIAGDMFTEPLQREFDLVLLANICHLFDEATNQALLRRLANILQPGGTLAIIDVLPSPDPVGHRAVSLYALGLLQRTATGGVHPLSSYQRWMSDAGLETPTVQPLDDELPISLITAALS